MPLELFTDTIIPQDQPFSVDVTEAASFVRAAGDDPTLSALANALIQLQSAINLIQEVLRSPLPLAEDLSISAPNGAVTAVLDYDNLTINAPDQTSPSDTQFANIGNGQLFIQTGVSQVLFSAQKLLGGQGQMTDHLGNLTITINGELGKIFVSNSFNVGVNQVVNARKLGWGVPTGTVSRATFNPATATLLDVAQRLAALIQDLHAGSSGHGLIGT